MEFGKKNKPYRYDLEYEFSTVEDHIDCAKYYSGFSWPKIIENEIKKLKRGKMVQLSNETILAKFLNLQKKIDEIEIQLNNTLDCDGLKMDEYDEDDFFTARETALIVKLQHFYDWMNECSIETNKFKELFGNYVYDNED